MFEGKCRAYESIKLEALIREDFNIDSQHQLYTVLKEAPASANFLVQLADRLEKRHAPTWMIAKHYEKAVECDPEYSVPYNKLAQVYLQLGEENQAIDILQKGYQFIPSNPKILNNLGFYYDRTGKTAEAISCFEKALEINPSDSMIWLNLAQAHLSCSDLNAASDCLNQAEKLGEYSLTLNKELGKSLVQAERYQEALQLLTEINQKYSDDAEIHHQLADLYSIMGDPAQAIDHYREMLRIQPERYDAMTNLGILLAGQGNINEAYELFEKASQYKPNHPVILCNQGLALERKNQFPQAVEKYKQALEYKPDWPFVENRLAWILATHQDSEIRDGQRALELAQKIGPDSDQTPPAYLDTLAAAYAETGQYEKAEQTAQKALQLAESSGNKYLASQIKKRIEGYAEGHPYRSEDMRPF